MKKNFFLFLLITLFSELILLILTTSCCNNNALSKNSEFHSSSKEWPYHHIEISGFPSEMKLVSSMTDVVSIGNKLFKIDYGIKILGNGNDNYSTALDLRVLLETSLLEDDGKNFSEVVASKSVGNLSIKIIQPQPGQDLSVNICPSSILNWNFNTGAADTYIVSYKIIRSPTCWETSPRSDGFLYGTIKFSLECSDSFISSGSERKEINRFLKNTCFIVMIRKKYQSSFT